MDYDASDMAEAHLRSVESDYRNCWTCGHDTGRENMDGHRICACADDAREWIEVRCGGAQMMPPDDAPDCPNWLPREATP